MLVVVICGEVLFGMFVLCCCSVSVVLFGDGFFKYVWVCVYDECVDVFEVE